MQKNIVLDNLSNPQDLTKLKNYLRELYQDMPLIYMTTAPNGNISAYRGRVALYNNSGTYTVWVNTDGGTTWQEIDSNSSGDLNKLVRFETPSPVADGTTTEFTVANAYVANSLLVKIDGIEQILGTDYTAGGGTTFTFTTAPATGEILWVSYIKV